MDTKGPEKKGYETNRLRLNGYLIHPVIVDLDGSHVFGCFELFGPLPGGRVRSICRENGQKLQFGIYPRAMLGVSQSLLDPMAKGSIFRKR